MTSTDQPRLPRTVADLVLDDRTGDDPGRPIVDDTTRSPHGLLDKLSASGCRWIRRQVLAKLKELLGDNLADVLMSAWATGGDIARAARETAEDPTAERLVLVHEQQVGWARDLTISLVFDERLSTDFQGRVTVTFELGRIEAVVRGGWLMGVNYDRCAVTGALELEGNLIARKLVPLPIDIALELPRPIDLAVRSKPMDVEFGRT